MQSRKFFSAVAILLALSCVCSPTAWAQYGASLRERCKTNRERKSKALRSR